MIPHDCLMLNKTFEPPFIISNYQLVSQLIVRDTIYEMKISYFQYAVVNQYLNVIHTSDLSLLLKVKFETLAPKLNSS